MGSPGHQRAAGVFPPSEPLPPRPLSLRRPASGLRMSNTALGLRNVPATAGRSHAATRTHRQTAGQAATACRGTRGTGHPGSGVAARCVPHTVSRHSHRHKRTRSALHTREGGSASGPSVEDRKVGTKGRKVEQSVGGHTPLRNGVFRPLSRRSQAWGARVRPGAPGR